MGVGEDGAGYVAEGFGIRETGAEVGEPEFFDPPGIGSQAGGFAEEHVAVFPGFGEHFFFAIHAFADEEVGVSSGGGNGGDGARIGAVGELDTAAGGPQHHVGGVGLAFVFNGFAFFLQAPPEFHGDAELAGAVGVEFTLAGEHKAVAVAGDAVLHLEGVDVAVEEVHGFPGGFELADADIEREIGGDDTQGIDHAFRAHGADDGEVFGATHVAHGEQQAGEAGDVVGVQVGDEDFVYRLEAHADALGSYLRAFAAVDQDAVSLVAHHERGEPAIHQRQGAAGSQ